MSKRWRYSTDDRMPVEIERKFLVRGDAWRASVTRTEHYCQGYLATTATCSVRVRVGGGEAWLGLKGRVVGASRPEYEYSIPATEAGEILDTLCDEGRVEKYRHWVAHGDHEWEVDEFLGANAGLVVAELELEREDEGFELPSWLGPEVTHDVRYYNASLAQLPYRGWASRHAIGEES
jgi:adenylate cyclase